MSESTETAAEKPAPAKGGKLVMILALVNFLGVLGLAGYLVYTQQHAAAQGQPAKGAAKDAHGAPKAGEHGEAKEEGEHGEAKEEGEHGEAKEEGEHGGGHGEAKEEGGQGGGHGEAKEGGGHGGGEEEEEDEGKLGPLLALESMVTNMAEPDSDRYLKVGMQLRVTSESAKAEVESHLVPVRNQILLYLSSLTLEETSGADNKRAIQKRVKRIANEAMPSSRIKQVYFTEFVIQ